MKKIIFMMFLVRSFSAIAQSESDVVFSEIMANPGTGSDQPEYVELYNAGDLSLSLSNYLFYYGDKAYALPNKTIAPKSYFVLCKTTAVANFDASLTVAGVTSFPTLANTGKLLQFGKAGTTEIIAWFEYSDKMYNDAEKKANGGYSLECIDVNNVSNLATNWSASIVAGGTPAAVNSIQADNPDLTAPSIVSVLLADNFQVKIYFSKPMNETSLTDLQSYTLDADDYHVLQATTNPLYADSLTLQLNAFPPQGEMVGLHLTGVRDRSGNALGGSTVFIGNAAEADSADVIINEILFNPPTDGADYVELYNISEKILDLRYLSITSRKPSDGSFNAVYSLTQLPLFLSPQQYIVVSIARESVCAFFDCREESQFAEPTAMPSLANESGCAVILNNRNMQIIDQLYYTEGMHAKGLSDKKGVALERIRWNQPTQDATNWTSATSQSGYGTPGYVNSQNMSGKQPEAGVEVEIDYSQASIGRYQIRYRVEQSGYNSRMFIFDAWGKKQKTLLLNAILGPEGVVEWDGKDESGKTLAAGIYVVYTEAFNMEGRVVSCKTPVVCR